jgi:putative restriction endonuclease
MNRAYGIYRAAEAQRGNAALSVNSSFAQRRYQDEETAEGILYRYQDGPIGNHFNRWLREAFALQVPLVYFVGTRRNWYRPEYPTFVEQDSPDSRTVLLTFGKMRGPYEEREPAHIDDPIERRYVVRQLKQRLHQTQFRGVVLPAYDDRCTICRLRELSLLDAAHIDPDPATEGEPFITNGLSMCTIHHRAFDQRLVGVSPDYEVHVSHRLLEEEDGPMLEVLKGFDRQTIHPPSRRANRPDRERLAARFEGFE